MSYRCPNYISSGSEQESGGEWESGAEFGGTGICAHVSEEGAGAAARGFYEGIFGMIGLNGLIDQFSPTTVDKIKSDIAGVQNDTQQFMNAAMARMIKSLLDIDDILFIHDNLNEKLSEHVIKYNNELLIEKIEMNTVYIVTISIALVILYIYIYISL